jgi:hypothetical protein
MNNLPPYDGFEQRLSGLLDDLRELRADGSPCAERLRAAPRIERWSLGLLPTPCLLGTAFEHPLLGSGRRIHTSMLILIDPEAGWARTLSRFYRLGLRASPECLNEGSSH